MMEEGAGAQSGPTQEEYAAVGKTIGKILLSLHTQPLSEDTKHPNSKGYKTFDWWKVRLEVMAFIFAIAYAFITYFQWRDAGHTFQQAQRPWVGPSFPVDNSTDAVFDKIESGVPYRWHYRIKNYGNSPALHSIGHARTFAGSIQTINWNDVKQQIESLDLPENLQSTLFNGQEYPDAGVSNRPLPDALLEQVNSGLALVVLGGRILYLDKFREQHTTTWCVIYVPPEPGKLPGFHSCPVPMKAD
jgi:hypothetical protein